LKVHLDNHTPCYSVEHRASSYSGVAMLIRLGVLLLCCTALAACNRSDDSTGSAINPAGDWAKVGETDSYVYYADHASIRKADETVTMSDLFDSRRPRLMAEALPLWRREPSGNMTVRARRANRSSRAGSQERWVPGPSCAPPLA
ncbi:MAG: surface-adhesin E family protein, partial [Nitrospirota bacterium]